MAALLAAHRFEHGSQSLASDDLATRFGKGLLRSGTRGSMPRPEFNLSGKCQSASRPRASEICRSVYFQVSMTLLSSRKPRPASAARQNRS